MCQQNKCIHILSTDNLLPFPEKEETQMPTAILIQPLYNGKVQLPASSNKKKISVLSSFNYRTYL